MTCEVCKAEKEISITKKIIKSNYQIKLLPKTAVYLGSSMGSTPQIQLKYQLKLTSSDNVDIGICSDCENTIQSDIAKKKRQKAIVNSLFALSGLLLNFLLSELNSFSVLETFYVRYIITFLLFSIPIISYWDAIKTLLFNTKITYQIQNDLLLQHIFDQNIKNDILIINPIHFKCHFSISNTETLPHYKQLNNIELNQLLTDENSAIHKEFVCKISTQIRTTKYLDFVTKYS